MKAIRRRVKVVLDAPHLHTLLGLPEDAIVIAATASVDPVAVHVVISSPDVAVVPELAEAPIVHVRTVRTVHDVTTTTVEGLS